MRQKSIKMMLGIAPILLVSYASHARMSRSEMKDKGVRAMDVKRVEACKSVEFAYLRPGVVHLVEKMAKGACKDCPDVCELNAQVCKGYRTAPYDLVKCAVTKMLDCCPDDRTRACLTKYCKELDDKTVRIVMKDAVAPKNSSVTRTHVCVGAPGCQDLVPPVFQDFGCPTAVVDPVEPTPPSEFPQQALTAVLDCDMPPGAVVLCDIEVGSIVADEITTDQLCVTEDINVEENIIANGDISAQGDLIAGGNLSAEGDLIGGGDLQLPNGSIFATGNLNILGSGFIGQDLEVGGDIIAGGKVLFSGSLIANDLCVDRLQAQTAILGNTELCQVVLQDLFVKGFVQFDQGTGAFCGTYPAKQGFGELVFTALDICDFGCPEDLNPSGCTKIITNTYGIPNYEYFSPMPETAIICGARLGFLAPEGLGVDPVSPHVDFAVPKDYDPNVGLVEVDLHLIIPPGGNWTPGPFRFDLIINRMRGDQCVAYELTSAEEPFCVTCDPIAPNPEDQPQHVLVTVQVDPNDAARFGTAGGLRAQDWIRITPGILNQNWAPNDWDPADDCILISSIVFRYPRVDAFEAMLIPPANFNDCPAS